jgi:ABC-2 type transport system permease protein
LFLHSDIFKNILQSIPFILVIFLLSFIAYSLLAGILASMTTSIEDYQQIQAPLSIIMVVGYYLAIFSALYDSSLFIKIFSYIPFMSAIIAPSLLLMGQYTLTDMLISIVLLLGTNFILIRYGLKIYKVGILNYSSSKLWKKMIKAVKEEKTP